MATKQNKPGYSINMYNLGTGDCFVIRIVNKDKSVFKIMIDCGAMSAQKNRMRDTIKQLIKDVDNHVDVLIVTHEHKDHVYGFDRCIDLFEALSIGEIWMAWTENDSLSKVKEWKKEYGKHKFNLTKAMAAFNDASERDENSLFSSIYDHPLASKDSLESKFAYSTSLRAYAELNMDESNEIYSGGLKGMRHVKERLKPRVKRYFKQGDIIEDIKNLTGVRIFVLGPPDQYDSIKNEGNNTGSKGEGYKHNKHLEDVRMISSMSFNSTSGLGSADYPFDKKYIVEPAELKASNKKQYHAYTGEAIHNSDHIDQTWRRIDFDWLFGASNLALRLEKGINNLSLAIAIEFLEEDEMLLFPGDAEIGSWLSWHDIEWELFYDDDTRLTTEDILNQTTFYKVAHHTSHKGTAKNKGLKMMVHPRLTSMATLDFSNIMPNWKNTMPNKGILIDLLKKTKGRLAFVNTDNIVISIDKDKKVPLQELIEEYQELHCTKGTFTKTKRSIEYRVDF